MKDLYTCKTFSLPIAFKDADSQAGIVTGYFSAFGNKDSDGDIIQKGAFTRSIIETGPDSSQPRIKHLLNHNTTQPLGKLMVLKEDSTGLYYESKLGTHSLGKDFVLMVESGLITEHSIGFRTMRSAPAPDGKANLLTDLQLFEGSSLTSWGANPLTPLTGMKSTDYEGQLQLLIKQHKAIETFCNKTTATDETISMLLLSNSQLSQKIIDLTKEQADPQELSSAVQDTKGSDVIDSLKKSIQSLFKDPNNGSYRNKRPDYSRN